MSAIPKGPAVCPLPAFTSISITVARMSAALQAALADPALRRQLAERGTTPRGGPAEDYARLAASELERWQRVVTAGRIRAD